MPYKIIVANLRGNYSIVQNIANYGTIIKLEDFEKFCVIEMETKEQAYKAMSALNGNRNGRKPIQVRPSRSSTIYVGNLHPSTKVHDLKKLFNQMAVTQVELYGKYGFVHFECVNVERIILKYNGTLLNGQPILVKKTTGKRTRRQCFICQSTLHIATNCRQKVDILNYYVF